MYYFIINILGLNCIISVFTDDAHFIISKRGSQILNEKIMPTYEFKCECGKVFEEIIPMSERNNPVKCECGKKAKRNITTPNLAGFDEWGSSK